MDKMVQCFKYLLVLSAFWSPRFDVDAAVAKNSSPFDPFRLECPFFHAIVRMDLQRIESSEGVRTDTMITSFCENIKKLYPSPRDPTLTTADENCRWTDNFKLPVDSFHFTDTCNGREFVSGISRQSPGEYGLLCCKIKDRKKGDCSTVEFRLPTADTPAVEVERGKRILTGIGHDNGRMVAQFCDMQVMSKKEVDEEFIANARAQLLAQGEDKVENPADKEDGLAEPKIKAASPRATTKSPTRLSSPGIRPPSGFAQSPRGRSPANPADDGDDDGQKASPKSSNDIARLAVIKNAISAPAAQASKPGRVPPGSKTSSSRRPTTKTTITLEETEETTVATTNVETTEAAQTKSDSQEDQTTTKQASKSTRTSTSEPTLKTTTLGDISPDPAHFQVLGIPRPASPIPAANPKPTFSRPSPEADQSDDPDKTAAPEEDKEKTSSAPKVTLPPIEPEDEETPSPTTTAASETEETPAPDRQKPKKGKKNEDNKSGDKTPKPKGKEEKKPTKQKANKPKTKKSGEEKIGDEEFPVPASNFGNVSDISNGIVLSAQHSIESAVAPPKPLFTILPPPPKFATRGGKNPVTESSLVSTESTSSTTTVSTTTGLSRLECHTNSAWRDPISNLVVACGQGDDIWVPSRCQPGLLCLLGKDSSYRLCCSVRV